MQNFDPERVVSLAESAFEAAGKVAPLVESLCAEMAALREEFRTHTHPVESFDNDTSKALADLRAEFAQLQQEFNEFRDGTLSAGQGATQTNGAVATPEEFAATDPTKTDAPKAE